MLNTYPYEVAGEGIWEINEFDGVSMFLVVGSERALLIDTGVGIGDLKTFVGSLTDKPLEVFLTHNHRDHVGNAPLFSKVHMSYTDRQIGPVVRPWTSKESRLKYARHTLERYHDRSYPWTADDVREFTEKEEPEVILVDDGHVFDLGDRKLTCWFCSGHTPGSMVLIDSKTGYLFCGDSCNQKFGLGVRPIPGLDSVSVQEALESLKRIWDMDFDHQRIFNGHADYRPLGQPLKVSVYPTLMEGLGKIMEGDFTVCKEWIQEIDTVVETALFGDVAIQFHSDNIYKKTIQR